MDEKTPPLFEMKVEGALAEVLLTLSKWIKIYVLFAVAGSALAIGVSISYIKLLLPVTTTARQNSVIISLISIALYTVSFISLYFMYLFGTQIPVAIRNDSTETLQTAFNNFKKATIITVGIQVIAIISNAVLLYSYILMLLRR